MATCGLSLARPADARFGSQLQRYLFEGVGNGHNQYVRRIPIAQTLRDLKNEYFVVSPGHEDVHRMPGLNVVV